MTQQYYSPHTERHLKLWLYLLPVIGIIPALWTLYRPRKDSCVRESEHREQEKVSRLSVTLVLIWFTSYALLSLGATHASEIFSFRLLYANTILTTAYFVTCTYLMSRLGHNHPN